MKQISVFEESSKALLQDHVFVSYKLLLWLSIFQFFIQRLNFILSYALVSTLNPLFEIPF